MVHYELEKGETKMKRYISLIVMTLCFLTSSYAQEQKSQVKAAVGEKPAESKSSLGIGGHIGPVFSIPSVKADGKSAENISRTRLMLGINGEVALTEILFIQPELNFVQKGFQKTLENELSKIEVSGNMNYLEIPVLLKAKFQTSAIKPYVLGGPSVAVLVAKGFNSKVSVGSKQVEASGDIEDLKTFDLLMNLGAGVEIPVAQQANILVGLRYSYGLLNAVKNVGPDSSYQNHSVQLLTGMQLAI